MGPLVYVIVCVCVEIFCCVNFVEVERKSVLFVFLLNIRFDISELSCEIMVLDQFKLPNLC